MAVVRVASPPSPLTARAVSRHTPPSTGGNQKPKRELPLAELALNRPPQLSLIAPRRQTMATGAVALSFQREAARGDALDTLQADASHRHRADRPRFTHRLPGPEQGRQ